MAKTKGKNDLIPSVLAFERKLVTSDALMYGTTWDKRKNETEPRALALVEKSVRGTISNRLKKALAEDPIKLNAEVEKANLQKVDNCSLRHEEDTLVLKFSLKVLSGVGTPSICNNVEFLSSYKEVSKKYIEEFSFEELGRRYAHNLATARFLWRNRVGCEKIETIITVKSNADEKEDIKHEFDSLEIPLNDFETSFEEVNKLGSVIAEALSGRVPYKTLLIETHALVGEGQEVYPSEEMLLDETKSKKSKILYAPNNHAGMHSQKIGNAIRTIDTWYPAEKESEFIGPIAVEPYGSVTTMGKAFRTPRSKSDFYTLFDKFALGEELDDVNMKHFVMATLVRGGVFGKSGKE